MPEIDKQSLSTVVDQITREGFVKFVREKGRIWWDDGNKKYGQIAEEAGMNKPDDAGAIIKDEEKELSLRGSSKELKVPKDETSRNLTLTRLENICGGTDVKVNKEIDIF